VVQINGRVRGKVQVESGMGEEELKKGAFRSEDSETSDGLRFMKVVVVPDKLVNVVVG